MESSPLRTQAQHHSHGTEKSAAQYDIIQLHRVINKNVLGRMIGA